MNTMSDSDRQFIDEVQQAASDGIVNIAAMILAGVPVSQLDDLVEAAIAHAKTMPIAYDAAQQRARDLHVRPSMVVPDSFADTQRPALYLVDTAEDDFWAMPTGRGRAA